MTLWLVILEWNIPKLRSQDKITSIVARKGDETMTNSPEQFGFDSLLADADADNQARQFEQETAHLPETMEEAIALYRQQIEQHHVAMLKMILNKLLRSAKKPIYWLASSMAMNRALLPMMMRRDVFLPEKQSPRTAQCLYGGKKAHSK